MVNLRLAIFENKYLFGRHVMQIYRQPMDYATEREKKMCFMLDGVKYILFMGARLPVFELLCKLFSVDSM